jgi:hypothetical protein
MVLVVPLRIESTRAVAKDQGSETLAGATGND